MKKVLFYLTFVFTCSASIQDDVDSIIRTESLEIQKSFGDYERLSSAFIARGESYLLLGQNENALGDLQKAYEVSLGYCFEKQEKDYLNFRALFGMAVAYCNLDCEETAIHIFEELIKIIDSYSGCVARPYIKPCAKILNPDKEPRPGWCQDVVKGTAEAMRLLASYATTIKAKAALFGIIGALENRCLQCCATGEFWKVCITPIIDKWKEWDDKWMIFHLPPDPAWD